MCLAGASRAGAELLEAVAHPELRVSFVWVPVLPADTAEAAAQAARRFTAPRAAHYPDGGRALARRLAEALGVTAKQSLGVEGGAGLAWDVYLAYGRQAADLTRPELWIHQLAVDHAPRLDAAALRRRVEELLRA